MIVLTCVGFTMWNRCVKKVFKIAFLLSLLSYTMIAIPNIKGQPNLSQENPNIKILIFHGGESPVSASSLSTFKDVLEGIGNFDVIFKSTIASYDEVNDFDVIVLVANKDLANVSDFILQFISEGGSLLISPPNEDFRDIDNITKYFGVSVVDSFAIDNVSYVDNNQTILVKDTWESESPIFNNVETLIIPESFGFTFTNISVKHLITRYPIIWGRNTTILGDYNGTDAVLAVAIESFTESRIIAFGSYKFLTNDYINMADNRAFVLNAIKWLSKSLARLDIKNATLSKTEIILGENDHITVNFSTYDEFNYPIDVEAKVYVFRPGSNTPLMSLNATLIGLGKFSANISFEGLRSGIVEIWISVHKKFYGYSLYKVGDVTLIDKKEFNPLPDPITGILFVLIPILMIFYVVFRFYPKYKENKEIMRKIEKKTE